MDSIIEPILMKKKTEENNKKLALEAFDTLFNIVRLQDGILVEHWDVIQDEATQEQSKSGLPMFGDKFPQ